MAKIDHLIGKLAQDAAPVKLAPHPLKFSMQWIGGGVIYLAIALALSGVRLDWLERLQQPWFLAEIASLAGIFIAASISAAVLVFPDLYQKRHWAWAPIGMFALFLIILFFSWRADPLFPLTPLYYSMECTVSITLVAVLPAAWAFYSMRQYATTHHRLAGSVALLGAFSLGALWLRLFEINDSMFHVIAWHYLPMLVIELIGLWLGKRLLKW